MTLFETQQTDIFCSCWKAYHYIPSIICNDWNCLCQQPKDSVKDSNY